MPHENKRTRAEKMLFERLNMTDCQVVFEQDVDEVMEEEEEFRSYPGIRTIHRKYFMHGIVTTVDAQVLHRVGFTTHNQDAQSGCQWKFEDFSNVTRYFTWLSDKQAKDKHVILSAPHNMECEYHSALVDPPIGTSEHAVWFLLEKYKIDPSKYSMKGSKTVQELANEVSSGDCTLLVRDGSLCQLVDQVQLHLCNKASNEVLMEVEEHLPDGQIRELQMLPRGRRRPIESQFTSIKNLLRNQLKISCDGVNIIPTDIKIFETVDTSNETGNAKGGYPGLKVIRRTHVIHVELGSRAL